MSAATTAELRLIVQALYSLQLDNRAATSFSAAQVYDELLASETLGSLTLDEVEALLRLGARRGIFSLSCSNATLSYTLNPNALQQNYSNRVFASSEILNAGGAFCYVTATSRCGRCPTAGGIPNGTKYACCPCTLAANATTCSATTI